MTAEQMTNSIQLSIRFKRSRFGRALLLKKSLTVSNYPIIQLILKVVDFEGFEFCARACDAQKSDFELII